ncbi:uncharacterized protein EAE98_007722 [Botrytis deweyae]|uniref:Major facilitator superfamily (MFS) profile domain-containing protein n=1 Tax=Botrytis deweyae TaxID=2478750 RepID=A0ABQ7IH42_9HELO|nr:uncharacterized protein EAE98_007722 [Botrytis deweyae]KAF7923904.1 hypothetical protein EAE98_007722 [Botrytis deweyae]
MGAMILNGLGTSAYRAVIQLTIFNMFFVHERGRMLAVYLFGQQLGSISPFHSLGLISGGSIADGPGWRWSQYIVGIIDGVVILLLFFSFEETTFRAFYSSPQARIEIKLLCKRLLARVRKFEDVKYEAIAQFHFGRITVFSDDTTIYWDYFKRPFFLWSFPTAVIPGFIFAFGCTAGIVSFNTVSEIFSSDLYDHLSTIVGLTCFATLIGSTIGYFTGVLSDHIVIFLARRDKGVKEPEMRLWTLTASFAYATVGYMLYGWGAQTQASWVAVSIGLGALIAQQVSACKIATAYAMECFPGLAVYSPLSMLQDTAGHFAFLEYAF